jgi:hypothetical protein
VSDHVFKQIWDQLVAENRTAMLFFSGEVKSFAEWKQMLTSPSSIAAIAVDVHRGRFCHVAWLNGVIDHRANAHHAALGRFQPGAARAILRYWQGLRNADGTAALHLLLGVTPEPNLLARRALRVLGFLESGVVPMMCRDVSTGKAEPGVTSYCLLQELRLDCTRFPESATRAQAALA